MIGKTQFILFLVLSLTCTSNFKTLTLSTYLIHHLIKLQDVLKIFVYIYVHLSSYQRFNATSNFVPYENFYWKLLLSIFY